MRLCVSEDDCRETYTEYTFDLSATVLELECLPVIAPADYPSRG